MLYFNTFFMLNTKKSKKIVFQKMNNKENMSLIICTIQS